MFFKKNEHYFSITDVCKALNMSNVTDTLRAIDKDYIDSIDVIDSMKRVQSIYIISEPGLYQIIFRSRKKESLLFKNGYLKKFYHQLEKTGKYSIPDELKKYQLKKEKEFQNNGKIMELINNIITYN